MSLSCLLVTTNTESRFSYLENLVSSLEKFYFDEKIMSVDVLDSNCSNFFSKFQGWKILYGNSVGHIANVGMGLSHITSDYVFYTEDKVEILSIPQELDNILEIFDVICYNTHINQDFTNPTQEQICYINDIENYTHIAGDTFLKKSLFFYDEYYLCFPVIITKSILFRELFSMSQNIPRALEIGFSKAWLTLKKKKEIGIYVKADIQKYFPINLMDFFHMAQMKYWNNDAKFRPPSIKTPVRHPDYLNRKATLEDYERKWLNR